MNLKLILPILLALPLLTRAAHGAPPAPPDFNREVRPILARNCFKCHGTDEGQRMAGLRLDIREGALKLLASGGRAVVPRVADRSALVARIYAKDALMMPPTASNNSLTAEQKRTLKAWVAGGAPYEPHWAFVAPRQAALPPVKLAGWPRNAIDRFVLARLEKEGLTPAPPADRYALVRRVYLDLIGIPPTPPEADAFVADRKPGAYERVVDRLLNSPRYGERWARRWLDLARYSDTNGYEKDRPRSIWPYRDWVINAFNTDMPFDRFTVEQLAGDMLPGATLDDRIATGFHRNTMRNEEGGIDPLEYRFLAMVDRVATTGTTWMGLTIGCAQCHTHKYDPITQTDYYRTFAFLNNCDEPELRIARPMLAATRAAIEAEARAREGRLAGAFPAAPGLSGPTNLQRKFDAWLAISQPKAIRWTVARPLSARANIPTLAVQPDGAVLASGDQSKKDDYDVAYPPAFGPITAIRMEVLPDDSLPQRGPGRVDYEGPFGDFFLSELTLGTKSGPVKLTGATQTFASGANTAQAAIDGDPLTGWSINGAQGAAQIAVFPLAKPLAPEAFTLRLHFERYYAAGLGKFRISTTTDSKPAQASFPAPVEAALAVADAERTPTQRGQMLAYFLSIAPELSKERDAIKKIRDGSPAAPTTLVLTERPASDVRPTFVHHRGEYLQPTERVAPGVPAFLPGLPQGTPANRLAFARWLVSPANPLTARVAVNRQWAAFFGRGIVSTTEDFGYQGQPPTHPELLDYLAVAFVKEGWSLKKLDRMIVSSATYRQSSAISALAAARDPNDRLLSRAPRVRLDAELIRDAALSESGLLSGKVGGPSVYPPQPPGVTTDGAYGALAWNVSAGEDRYRRGLYTFSKRTAPYAMFSTFDAPTGELCLARREVSNTPLQALALLNDLVFVDAAQALGRATAAQPGTDAVRAAYLFRRCATRPPTASERDLMARFTERQRSRFAANELDPKKIAGDGPGELVGRAIWTTLARSLLNLDEVITKQ